MISDVNLQVPDSGTAAILAIIGSTEDPTPKQVSQGYYLCEHFSFDAYLTRSEWQTFWGSDDDQLPSCYGVCDSINQFKEKYDAILSKDRQYQYVISFTKISRDDQPSDGGWRWHKWGPYVGTKNPQCEYIHDEPEIEEVYTFHVYRRDL